MKFERNPQTRHSVTRLAKRAVGAEPPVNQVQLAAFQLTPLVLFISVLGHCMALERTVVAEPILFSWTKRGDFRRYEFSLGTAVNAFSSLSPF